MTDSVFCPPPSSLLPKSSSAAPDAARVAPSGAARVPAWRDKAMRMFLGRSLLAPVVAWRWHGRLNELHRRHDAPPPPARGLAKPLRSYLDSTWGPRRRLEALLGHHAWMEGRFGSEFLRAFYAGEGQIIARLPARKGSEFHAVIAPSVSASTQREGEIVLYLVNPADGVKLSRLTMTYLTGAGGPALAIGGLQGPFGGHKRAVIDSTRLLYGMRPKDATVLAARALAQALGLDLLAVCDERHILERLQGVAKHAGYDEYWTERGALADPRFGFKFPPLDAPTEATEGRDGVKARLIIESEAFVRRMSAAAA